MTKTSKLFIITAVTIVAVFVASWFLLIGPKRAEASQIKAQDQAAQDRISQLTAQLTELRSEAKDVPAQQAKLIELGKRIPAGNDLPDLIRNLRKRSDDADLELLSIKPAEPTPYVNADGTTATTTAPTGTTGTTGTTGATGTAGATGTGAALMTLPLELDVSGSYSQLKIFVLSLEEMNRSFMVTGFDITGPDPSGSVSGSGGSVTGKGPLSVKINGEVFTAPEAPVPAIPAQLPATADAAK